MVKMELRESAAMAAGLVFTLVPGAAMMRLLNVASPLTTVAVAVVLPPAKVPLLRVRVMVEPLAAV